MSKIVAAIASLNDRNGSSLSDIKTVLSVEPNKYKYINAALSKGVRAGTFREVDGKFKVIELSKDFTLKERKAKERQLNEDYVSHHPSVVDSDAFIFVSGALYAMYYEEYGDKCDEPNEQWEHVDEWIPPEHVQHDYCCVAAGFLRRGINTALPTDISWVKYYGKEEYDAIEKCKKAAVNACQCGELGTKRCNAKHCHASVCEKDECGRDHCFSQESRGETFWCDACHKKNDSAPSCDYCWATEMEDSQYSLVKCSKRGCKKHVPSNPGDGCCEAGYNEHYFCGECENRYCNEHAVKCCN